MPEDAAPETLQRLVTWRLADLRARYGLSMADAANRATEAGYPISKVRLSQLKNTERLGRVPYRATLKAISVGLDLPLERVQDAANRSAGNPVRPRRYRKSGQATVRRLCVDCSNRSGDLDQLVLVLPHDGLTNAEIVELCAAVEQTVTRQLERRLHSEEAANHQDA